MKKTYMIAMQAKIVLHPTVYLEVVADSAADAMRQAREEAKTFAARHASDFMDECKTDLPDAFADQMQKAKVVPIDCGRASQYHSDAECETCRSVAGKE